METEIQLPLLEMETPVMGEIEVGRCSAKAISLQTAANMVEKYHYAHLEPHELAVLDEATGILERLVGGGTR